MDILLVMLAGMAVGRFLFPAKAKRGNERVALLCRTFSPWARPVS